MTVEVIRATAPIATLLAAFFGGRWAYKIHQDKVKHENEKEKISNERELKLASVLISNRLAVFIKGCLLVAADEGLDEYGQPAGRGREGSEPYCSPTTDLPNWEPSSTDAQWKYLEPNLVDQLFKLSLLVDEANWSIAGANFEPDPPDYYDYFYQRRMQYADLGMKAIRLRTHVVANAGLADEGMPQLYRDALKSLQDTKSELLENQRLREERQIIFTRELFGGIQETATPALINDDDANTKEQSSSDGIKILPDNDIKPLPQ
ncbi:hypothetical protein [Comamonas thiooxydans]|uniref:hypothetical protein n=1 Tax=Comamonas thiooxydans TaxID=363952 RepID=UPI0005F89780|nr:hypothetical protein [Comamonas thiooxydans]